MKEIIDDIRNIIGTRLLFFVVFKLMSKRDRPIFGSALQAAFNADLKRQIAREERERHYRCPTK